MFPGYYEIINKGGGKEKGGRVAGVEGNRYIVGTCPVIPGNGSHVAKYLNTVRNLNFKVVSYILLRYSLFVIFIVGIYKEIKWVKWSDLHSCEDWFMFIWLFIVPVLIEVIIFTLPIKYGINRIEVSKNKIPYFLLFSFLFLIEFIFCNSILAKPFNYIKVFISVVLFFLYFRKSLFKEYFPKSENI